MGSLIFTTVKSKWNGALPSVLFFHVATHTTLGPTKKIIPTTKSEAPPMPEPLTRCSQLKGSSLGMLWSGKKLLQSHGHPFLSTYPLPLLTCFSETWPPSRVGSFSGTVLASGCRAALDFVSRYTKINCIQCIFCNLKPAPELATSIPKPKLNPPIEKTKSKTKPESLLTCFLPTFLFCVGQDWQPA